MEIEIEHKVLDPEFEENLERFYINYNVDNINNIDTQTKIKLTPPVLGMDGPKKTVFVNFQTFCQDINRFSNIQHVANYIATEFSTTVSLNQVNSLIIKGRFDTKHISNIMKRYIKEYSMCMACKSINTRIIKENRIQIIKCNVCGSQRSVTKI